MKSYVYILLTGIMCCLFAQADVAPGDEIKVPEELSKEIDNIHRLDKDVYRSGQPSRSDFALLEKHGIKSVLNLREYHSDKDKAKKTDLHLVQYPVAAGDMTQDHLLKCVFIIQQSPKPILVHCWHGSDRTGVVCAAYRIAIQGWKVEDALKEFQRPELGYHSLWYPNLPKLLQSIDWKLFRQKLDEMAKPSK